MFCLGGVKTASSRRADSPTPTTDPDGPPPSTTPASSQRKTPSRGKGEKGRKPQTPSRTSKRSSSTPVTKGKKWQRRGLVKDIKKGSCGEPDASVGCRQREKFHFLMRCLPETVTWDEKHRAGGQKTPCNLEN